MAYTQGKGQPTVNEASKFIGRRIRRIYPLLWSVLTIKILFLLVIPSLNQKAISLSMVLSSYLLLPSKEYVMDVQWTLVHEMCFYFIFASWIWFGKRFAIFSAITWLTSITLVEILNQELASGSWSEVLLSTRNYQFLAGVGCALALKRCLPTLKMGVGITLMGLITVGSGVCMDWNGNLVWGIIFGILVYGVSVLDLRQAIRWPQWLVYLGNASYSIYLVHTPVQLVIVMVGRKRGVSFGDYGQLWLHLTGVVSVLVGVVCYYYLERHLLAIGNRKITTEIT